MGKYLGALGIHGGALLFRLLGAIAGWLPPRALLRFGRACGRLYSRSNSRDTAVAEAQLRYVFGERCPMPSYSAADGTCSTAELTRSVFGHVGQAIVELLFLPRLADKAPFQVTSVGQEAVKEAITQGRGAICLSGHLGCIELLAAYQCRQGVPLSVVGRRPNYPVIADLLNTVRTSYGVQTLWRDDQRMTRDLLRTLAKGGFIAALIDQDTSLENMYVPFFGLEAAYPVSLIRLAVDRKLPVFSSFIVRTGLTEHLVITEPLSYDPADPEAVQSMLRTFNERLEVLIRRYPEQWIWWHRRWRRRPGVDYREVHTPSSREYIAWMNAIAANEHAAAQEVQCES